MSLLRIELDEGEAEAIALFIQEPVAAILLDEKNAIRVARRLRLTVLSTVGILICARQIGLISNLKKQFDNLRTVGKFRLSQLVDQEALKRVGKL